jgi:hypothetical protein
VLLEVCAELLTAYNLDNKAGYKVVGVTVLKCSPNRPREPQPAQIMYTLLYGFAPAPAQEHPAIIAANAAGMGQQVLDGYRGRSGGISEAEPG